MKKKYCILVLFLFCGILSACHMPKSGGLTPTETAEPQAVITEEATAEPTPEPQPADIVLVLRSAEKPLLSDALAEGVRAYCGDSCECREILSAEEAEASEAVKAVFLADRPAEPAALRARFPQAKIAFIGDKDQALPDTRMISYNVNNLPFLLGMATQLIAYDYRSVGLLPSDSELYGPNAEEAFLNGAHYFCGNCRATVGPYNEYPLTILLPSASSAGDWTAKLNEAKSSVIYTVFLCEEARSEAIYQTILEMNAKVIGVGEIPESLNGNQPASLHYDWEATVREVMGSEADQGIQPVVLAVDTGTDTETFGAGKTDLILQTYASLLSGELSPLHSDAVYN